MRDSKPPSEYLDQQTLEAALRRERMLGLAGHWAYDINRHITLRQRLSMLVETIDRQNAKKPLD